MLSVTVSTSVPFALPRRVSDGMVRKNTRSLLSVEVSVRNGEKKPCDC